MESLKNGFWIYVCEKPTALLFKKQVDMTLTPIFFEIPRSNSHKSPNPKD